MHSCDEMTQLISAAIDGELSREETVDLNEHLNNCSVCRALFDDLRALNNAAIDTDCISAPAGFAQQVMDRIAANPAQEAPVIPFPAKRKLPSSWKKWALSAALFAVVVFGAYTLPGFFAMGGSAPASDSFLIGDQEKSGSINNSMADSSLEADSVADCSKDQSAPSDDNLNICSYSLTFSTEEKPDGLDEFPFTEDETGTFIYTVTADYFYSVQSTLFYCTPAPAGDNVTYFICIKNS